MNIQSLSIAVPSKGCINNCKFCCSKMHGGDYEDKFSNMATYASYVTDMRKRMQYARENGCNTLMLTGNNEPQQNIGFLKVFAEVNKSLPSPFKNIEIQTSGAGIGKDMLTFLRDAVGVTTIAISVACLSNPATNRDIIQTKDNTLSVSCLSRMIKEKGMNLRICLNMNDHILNNCYGQNDSELSSKEKVLAIIDYCKYLEADQITCRALWAPEDEGCNADQVKWISENVTEETYAVIREFKNMIREEGKYLETLEYGADRYDFRGFSVVVDEDSMAQSQERKESVKYLILRPDGKLYSKWDTKASLIF